MNKQASNSKQFTENETREQKERSCFLTQLEIPFLMFLLKKLSTKEQPLSAGKLAQYMSSLTGEEHSSKTISRKLKKLCILQNDFDEELINNTLFLTFGGSIVETTNEDAQGNIKKVQSRYYFKPLLDAGDTSLICGAIASNRYLSRQEKNYLLSREQTLTILPDETYIRSKNIEEQAFFPTELPEKPTSRNNDSPHGINLLHHVNQLYDAIEKGYQIQVIYGIYDLDEQHLRKIRFHARNASKPYILNPYALLWNGGSYYLLATHNGHDNPVHFRVDRIISIKSVMQQEDATQPQERAKLPDSLKPFFTSNGTTPPEFQPDKYTATYPLMGIYDEADCLDCYIECTADTLSILIDAFGSNLSISPSPLPHSSDELNFHGKPQNFFSVQIKQVQYDNVRQFCLQQHSSITAIHPKRLVEDIEKELQASLKKYQKLVL